MSTANGHNNDGHGHVFPRPDGIRMRCGGPRTCSECSADFVRKNSSEGKRDLNARRYEWLRTNSDPGPNVVRCVTLDQQTEPVETRMCFGDELDAKIDAEIAAFQR